GRPGQNSCESYTRGTPPRRASSAPAGSALKSCACTTSYPRVRPSATAPAHHRPNAEFRCRGKSSQRANRRCGGSVRPDSEGAPSARNTEEVPTLETLTVPAGPSEPVASSEPVAPSGPVAPSEPAGRTGRGVQPGGTDRPMTWTSCPAAASVVASRSTR